MVFAMMSPPLAYDHLEKSARSPSGQMPDAVRQKLRDIIVEHGRDLIQTPEQCAGLIADEFADSQLEASLLRTALQDGVPQELLDPRVPTPIQVNRLAKRLEKQRGLEASLAMSAVQAWVYALDLGTPPLNDSGPPSGLGEEDAPTIREAGRNAVAAALGASIAVYNVTLLVAQPAPLPSLWPFILMSTPGLFAIGGLYTRVAGMVMGCLLVAEPTVFLGGLVVNNGQRAWFLDSGLLELLTAYLCWRYLYRDKRRTIGTRA